jgi:hypothetical protein
MLRVEYGWAGEGKFWALNNRIAQADECCLNISKKYNTAAIANDLDFNLETFDKFIKFLKDDCELIRESGPGIITTDIIQENFEKVSEKRKKNQSYYKKAVSDTFSSSQSTESKIQQAENIQSKVKESKDKVKTPLADKSATEMCPQKLIRDLYNEHLPSLPGCKFSNKTVEGMVRARWKEDSERQNLKWWSSYFDSVGESDFLTGKVNGFQATYEWLVRPTNMSKILNGNYENREDKKGDPDKWNF